MVYIKGPVLDLTRITDCDSPYDAEFAIQLKNAESYTCVFGDGDSIVSSSETIHHVYNEKGLFPVRHMPTTQKTDVLTPNNIISL